jgi:hypothetical protein
MSNDATVDCFKVANLEASESRSSLYSCGICKHCFIVTGERAEDHCKNLTQGAGQDTPTTSAYQWQNTIPGSAREQNGISWRKYAPGAP